MVHDRDCRLSAQDGFDFNRDFEDHQEPSKPSKATTKHGGHGKSFSSEMKARKLGWRPLQLGGHAESKKVLCSLDLS